MSEHDREVVADYRRREVEAARLAHMARRQLLDSLTEERFGR